MAVIFNGRTGACPCGSIATATSGRVEIPVNRILKILARKRSALGLIAFLLLAGQTVAAAHGHEDATLHFVDENCLVCQFGSSLDDAAASVDAGFATAPLVQFPGRLELRRFGFGPRQAPNARAPPPA